MSIRHSRMRAYPDMILQDLSFICSQHIHVFLPPVRFTPNSRRYPAERTQDPLTIFKPMICRDPTEARWVQIDTTLYGTEHAVLVFIDGAAPSNGQAIVRAGCGISYNPDGEDRGYSFPLERVGNNPLTSNRAELRATHAALTLRHWECDGFGKIVIATDSQYMVSGVNEWVIRWRLRGWKTATGTPVANKDLWEMLLDAIEMKESSGVVVQFYLIERKYNCADSLAKLGAVSVYVYIF